MKQNRVLYTVLFFLCLMFVYFYGGKVPYMLFYLILALPLLSFLYTVLVYFRFKYVQDIDTHSVLKGSKVNLLFSVNNEDFFIYPYISVTFFGANTLFSKQFQTKNFSILPFGRKSFNFELLCKYRGTYDIGIHSIEIQDFLGIIRLSYRVTEPKSITVYPKIIPLDKFFLRTDYLSESHSTLNSRSEDLSTVADVRKYAYGDSLKRIHWKLTAKMDELMVKKYQGTSVTSAIILLDLKRMSFSPEQNAILEDKLIESTLSILHYCLFNWIPVNLVFYSEEIVTIHADNPLMFNDIYTLLAKIRFTGDVGFEDLLDVYLNETLSKTDIVLVTSNMCYALYNRIYRMANRGYDISLVYVSPCEITGMEDAEVENILSFLPELRVNAYKIAVSDDTKSALARL